MNMVLLGLLLTVSVSACNGGVTNDESEGGSESAAVGMCDYLQCGAPSCGSMGGDYCYNGGPRPGGYDNLGSSNDCRQCLKRGPSCGELGGNECLQYELRNARGGQYLLGQTYDCVSCVFQE